ncbi:MAG: hypothetical protein H6810_01415 [Phycisphaeraceae bacterium]|nr:MAG: hypothetical protein H6810_01415 [Phycisphaeraceae bacterium]
MTKGQHLSRYQQGIVRRFYLHRGAILLTRLQELTSDLAIAEGKKADTLWKRAADTLGKLETEPPIPASRVSMILESRDVAGLAQLVGELHARG